MNTRSKTNIELSPESGATVSSFTISNATESTAATSYDWNVTDGNATYRSSTTESVAKEDNKYTFTNANSNVELFTLSGFASGTLSAEGNTLYLMSDTAKTAIATVDNSTGKVKLTTAAFTAANSEITLTDVTGGSVYQLDATGLAQSTDSGVVFPATFTGTDTYTYKASGNLDYYTLTAPTESAPTVSKIKFTPAAGGKQFTISGLNNISGTSTVSDTAVGDYLTISGNTVTVNAAAVNLTNYSGTKIELGGTEFTALELADALKNVNGNKDHVAAFTQDGTTTTYSYKGAYNDAYFAPTTGSSTSYDFTASTEGSATTFSVTNLKAAPEVSAFSNDVLTLTADQLPDSGNVIISNSTYKLAVSGVATEAFKLATAGDNGTLAADGTYTPPTFKTWYTGSGSATITANNPTYGALFTISGLKGGLTVSYDELTKVVTFMDGSNSVGTVTLEGDANGNFTTITADISTDALNISGLTEGATLDVALTTNVTSVTSKALTIKSGGTVVASNSITLPDTLAERTPTWTVTDTTATYKLNAREASWTKNSDADSYKFHAAQSDDVYFVLSGVKSGASFDGITPSNENVITLTAEQLTTGNVTFTTNKDDAYTLNVADTLAPKTVTTATATETLTPEGWNSVSGGTATYKAADMTEGWSNVEGGKSITYSASVMGTDLFTLSGLASTVTLQDLNAVTVSEGKINLTSGLLPTATNTKLTLNDSSSTYKLAIPSGTARAYTDDASAEKTNATFTGTGSYSYESQYTQPYLLTADTSIEYKGGTDKTTFTLSGLVSGLTVSADGTKILNGSTEVGTISDGKVTLTAEAIATPSANTASALLLADTNTNAVYTALEIPNELQNVSDSKKHAAGFAADNGVFNYNSEYYDAYFTAGNEGRSYDFTASTESAAVKFSVTNLNNTATVDALNGALSGTTLMLTKDLLPNTLASGASIAINNIQNADSYTLALADNTADVQSKAFGGQFDGFTFTKAGTYSGYELKDGAIVYHAADNGVTYTERGKETIFTLSGLKSDITSLTLNGNNIESNGTVIGTLNGMTVTLNSNALPDSGTVALTGTDYSLALDSNVAVPTDVEVGDAAAGWNVSGTKATYHGAGKTAGYVLNSSAKTITYTEATDGANLLTLNGVKVGADFSNVTSDSNNVVTLTGDQLTTNDVTIDSDIYTLNVATDLAPAVIDNTKGWKSVSGGTATYKDSNTQAGWTNGSDGKSIVYNKPKTGTDLFTLTGLADSVTTTEQLSGVTVTDKSVTIDASLLKQTDGATISVSDSYTLTINNATVGTAAPASEVATFNSSTGEFSSSYTKAYFQGSGNSYTFKAATTPATFKLTGVTIPADAVVSDSGIKSADKKDLVTINNGTVTIYADALTEGKVSLEGTGYTLALDSNVATTPTFSGGGSLTVSDGKVTYTTKSASAYYTATSGTANSFDYVAASGGKTLTISGLKDATTTSNLTVSEDNKVITVTINDKNLLNFSEGDNVTFKIDGNAPSAAGYTLNVTGDAMTASTSGQTWIQIGADTYAYALSSIGAYYRFNGNDTLSYVAEAAGNHRLVLKGLSARPVIGNTTDGTTDDISFDETNHVATFNKALEGNIVVSSNAGGYSFAFKSDVDFSSMNFTGTAEAETFSVAGSSVNVNGGDGADTFDITGANANVNGGDGADTFNVGGASASVNGGAGDDTINVTGTDVTVTGGAGNDSLNFASGASGVIFLSEGTDSVQYGTNYYVQFESAYGTKLDGDNVIFTSGGKQLVVIGGKGQDISIKANGAEDVTTVNVSYDYGSMITYANDRQTAVILNGTSEASVDGKNEFTAPTLSTNNYASTAVSITASNSMTNAVYMNGNDNNNVITSNGNDNTIDGGNGNDRFYAGAGSETFVYTVGKGSDVIYNFSTANDKIQLSDATLAAQNVDISGNDIVYTFTTSDNATETLTLKNIFTSATAVTVNFVDSKDTDFTYQKGGAVINVHDVYLTSGATTYAVNEGDNISGYNSNVTLTGLKLKDIATASVDASHNVTLGVGDSSITINGGNGTLNIGGTVYTVGANYFSDGTGYTLTSGFSGTFNQPGAQTIDATFATGGVNFTGTDAQETFIVSGGSNKFTNYTAGNDVIKVASDVLNFADYTVENSSVTIGGSSTDGNKLEVTFATSDKKLTVVNGTDSQVYDFSADDGTYNDDKTAITLKSSTTTYTASESSIVTIDASEVSNSATVTANANANYLVTGSKGMTLTGGTGADTFAHGTSADVITDYSANDGDVVSISSGVNAITAYDGSGNLTLTIGNEGSIELQDVTAGLDNDTVNINGTDYLFDTDKQRIFTTNKRGIFLLGNESFDVANSGYPNAATVMANAGGSVKAGAYGLTMGGNGTVSLSGGTGSDIFLYSGGNVTVNSYESADRISLASGWAISGDASVGSDKTVTLTVTDGTTNGTLVLEGIESSTPVKIGSDSGEKTLYFSSGSSDPGSFSNPDVKLAKEVTVGSNADYGVLENGTNKYAALASITASKENVQLIGNSLANTFVLAGGTDNVLTGGIGADKFIFQSGGGVITDFGIGATKNGKAKAFDTTVTETNRNAPLTYAEGNDSIKVDGTVVEIAFSGHNVSTTTKNSVFSAYVTYDADGDGTGDYTIMLANMVKSLSRTGSSPLWKTDDVAAKSIKVWDTRTDGSTSKLISTTVLPTLFTTTDESEYKDNITALQDLVVSKAGSGVMDFDAYTKNPTNLIQNITSSTGDDNNNSTNG